jgi:hypothetical protein
MGILVWMTLCGQMQIILNIHLSTMDMQYLIMNGRVTDFENICIKCGKMYSEHPTTGRFSTVILFGHECAWNPDNEFKGFVKNTLRTSGYDLVEFGYDYSSDNVTIP